MNPPSRSQALTLDQQDPLAPLRGRFHLPRGMIYLDGNSLGAMPCAAQARVEEMMRGEWGEHLVHGWMGHGWMNQPLLLGDRIAPWIGAGQGEVVVADTLSVNIFKLLSAALDLRPERDVVLTDAQNFPTDVYMAQGLARLIDRGIRVEAVNEAEVEGALDQQVAVLMLTQVNYKTGRVHDLPGLTRAAHRAGALVLWDLAHSAWALPVDLNGAAVDFAAGCTYKYLNAGPGAPAFLFVARQLQDLTQQPLSGWLGHVDPFAFAPEYQPAAGIQRFRCSSPSIIALAPLDQALAIFEASLPLGGLEALRRKSIQLTESFIHLVAQRCAGHGLRLVSPRRSEDRGSQVSFAFEHGHGLVQALIARGVVGDFRTPDVMRFGFAPLYIRHVDVWDAVEQMAQALAQEEHLLPQHQQQRPVT